MYTYNWYQWLTFFYIYCFFGWIFESVYVSLKKRHFVNRGFLRIPMLPLYGSGAVMMLWVSLPVRNNLLLVYISGVIAATALEYVTGFVMERLFKVRYWDYSNQKFQLHGYICLTSSIAWGFLTILMTEVIHEPISAAVLSLNSNVLFFCVIITSAVFAADAYESTKEALALGKSLEAITRIKAEMDELQARITALKEEAAEQVSLAKEAQAERLTAAIESTAELLSAAKEETSERLTAAREGAAERLAAAKEETAERFTAAKDETVERLTAAKEGTAERLAAAKEGTAERLAAAKAETLILLARAKLTAADRLTAVKNETTRKLAVAKSGTAVLLASAHLKITERMTDAGLETAERLANASLETAGRFAAAKEERAERQAAAVRKREEELANLFERMERAKERRESLKRPNHGRIHHFYRKGILKGNPGAVSSKFAEALKELREQMEHADNDMFGE